ncbi:nucleotidyl transferase AbiEii/AbiGii toxin family protein [Thermodesulfatator atlanticus]|uniref:nucleotidyl transferase AbiEii/AbiGii toxin family protein n=1 Tax=Thermodesulfatator atlanticus TaxID=501497 RepID=UPI0003B32BC3|nr:nucleotidyl transferase AbiEii/AbiGii toxin family protein [Thermodesulfatator atlanticus]
MKDTVSIKKIESLQNDVLKQVAKIQKKYPDIFFVFTGGTALSRFYLKHRFSEDIDLIISGTDERSILRISQEFSRRLTICGRLELRNFDLDFGHFEWLLFSKDTFLKIELSQKFGRNIFPPKVFGDLLVEDLKGLLVGKIEAFLGREDPKDLIDLLICFQKHPDVLWEAINEASKMIPAFGYAHFLREIEQRPLSLERQKLFISCSLAKFEELRHGLIKYFFEKT